VAAAAGLVIWIAVPQQRSAPLATASSSAPESNVSAPDVAPDAKTPATSAPPGAPTAVSGSPEQDAPRRFAQERADALRKNVTPSEVTPAPAPAAPAALADKAADADAPLEEALPRSAAPKPETEQPLAEQRRQLGNRELKITGTAPALGGPTNGAAASAESSTPPPPARSLGQLAAAREEFSRASTLLAVASNNGARWRRSGDVIEFAPRAGAPFTSATLPMAADVVVAGAAPGGTVCWLVGRAGTVLVSTDGVRFVRGTAPAELTLTSVTATDSRTATVRAADGRGFRTTDGGTTWAPAP
jgi:hypothetical protein